MKIVFAILLVILLLLRRFRRSMGFQKYNKITLVVRMVLFALIAASILWYQVKFYTSPGNPALYADIIGIAAGLVLAYIATVHARFEKRENGLYFRTHVWVEVIVIGLFLARVLYRVVVLKDMFQPGEPEQGMFGGIPLEQNRMQAMHDPVTGAIFFLFCTYYLGYFSFIFKEGKKVTRKEKV